MRCTVIAFPDIAFTYREAMLIGRTLFITIYLINPLVQQSYEWVSLWHQQRDERQ